MVQEAETHHSVIAKEAEQQFHAKQRADSATSALLSLGTQCCKEVLSTSKNDSFGLKYPLVRSKLKRPSKERGSTCAFVSAHLSKTAATRPDAAVQPSSHVTSIPRLTEIVEGRA